MFVIREAFNECGLAFDLQIVKDGEAALSYLNASIKGASACPSLMVLDLNLPKVPGIEVLRQLRAAPNCSQIPVVVITSSALGADIEAVERLGVDAYFHKPSDLQGFMKLAQLVENILTIKDAPAS